MRDGLGSKVPVLIQSVSLLFSGLAVGFFTNWRLTLVILIGGPILVISSALTAKVIIKSFMIWEFIYCFDVSRMSYTDFFAAEQVGSGVAAREQLRYGIAGGIVSEALTSIRTISAFGSQQWELQR